MKMRLRRIDGKSAALHFASVTALLTTIFVPFAIIGIIASAMNPSQSSSPGMGALIFLIFIPFFYFIISYIGVRLFVFAYNLFAKRLGGIELEFEDSRSEYRTEP